MARKAKKALHQLGLKPDEAAHYLIETVGLRKGLELCQAIPADKETRKFYGRVLAELKHLLREAEERKFKRSLPKHELPPGDPRHDKPAPGEPKFKRTPAGVWEKKGDKSAWLWTPTRPAEQLFSKNGPALYFAYGSNLNVQQMRGRCRTALPVGPALLPDYRLTFRGVADVEPAPGDWVMGALWYVHKDDERALDSYEGWPWLYRKEAIRVFTDQGRVDAFVYVMNKTHVEPPSRHYLGVIAEGYGNFRLPTRCLAEAVARSYETIIKGV